MKILINRFTLRHNGIDYGTGDILEIEEEAGAKLAASSNGAISIVADRKTAEPPQTAKPVEPPPANQENPLADLKDENMVLPRVDPARAVVRAKGK